jgi:hypothetical protein
MKNWTYCLTEYFIVVSENNKHREYQEHKRRHPDMEGRWKYAE